KGQDRDGRKTPRSPERPDRVLHVLPHGLEQREPLTVAVRLFSLQHAAESRHRDPSRLLRRQPARAVVGDCHLEMCSKLVRQLAIKPPPLKQCDQPGKKWPHRASLESLKKRERMPAALCKSISSVLSCFCPRRVIA